MPRSGSHRDAPPSFTALPTEHSVVPLGPFGSLRGEVGATLLVPPRGAALSDTWPAPCSSGEPSGIEFQTCRSVVAVGPARLFCRPLRWPPPHGSAVPRDGLAPTEQLRMSLSTKALAAIGALTLVVIMSGCQGGAAPPMFLRVEDHRRSPPQVIGLINESNPNYPTAASVPPRMKPADDDTVARVISMLADSGFDQIAVPTEPPQPEVTQQPINGRILVQVGDNTRAMVVPKNANIQLEILFQNMSRYIRSVFNEADFLRPGGIQRQSMGPVVNPLEEERKRLERQNARRRNDR